MIPLTRYRFALGCTIIAATVACAQTSIPKGEYEPQVGQHGKDVIWVPTPQALVDKMLALGKVTPQDILVDLGSGDGRTVITAAKRGTSALGIEYNPDMVELSKRNAQKAGVTNKADFKKADLFETDIREATVVMLYLLPELNRRLRPKLFAELRPGARVVSHDWDMGREWPPDRSVKLGGDTLYLWVMPERKPPG